MSNPFNITKAVDYSDNELNEYWVDFPNGGFNEVIKPNSEIPMMILGSKGSGKTHLMKYFSYTMQCIRYPKDLLGGIVNEGYIGTFLRCSGLNAYRFSGKGESEETWESIFSYYLELWLGQLILNNLLKFLTQTDLLIHESIIVESIFDLFDSDKSNKEEKSFKNLLDFMSNLQRGIDFSINNISFTREKISDNIEILLNPGRLIFGIPEIIISQVTSIKDLKFLYLLDEFENFTSSQQKYFNTLIRERKNPTCFKIGSRKYGIRTKETLSAGEEIKLGSEYEEFDIDDFFRKKPVEYKTFIKSICIKRLGVTDFENNELEEYFEKESLENLYSKINSKGRNHIEKFTKKIISLKIAKSTIDIILKNIKFDKNILLERTNILLFYREWKKGVDLVKASEMINSSCSNFYNQTIIGNKKVVNHHSKVLDKYKKDLISALYRENNLQIESYIGFDNLVAISNGIPRHFLIILKHIYRWNRYVEKKTFNSKDNKISANIQLNALNDTAAWFLEDASLPGENGNIIKDCIERLCDYLRELRFSDIPPECSISSFSISSKVIPREIFKILNFLEQYSYLIKVETGRRNKNLNSRDLTYQINGLLAYEWELSLSRRGIVNLGMSEIKAIFSPEDDSEYFKISTQNINRYNTPFYNFSNNLSLFDK